MAAGDAGGRAWGHRHGVEGLRRGARRSDHQRTEDRRRVENQLDRMHDRNRAHAFQLSLFDTIRDRTPVGDGLTQAPALERIDRDGDFLLALGGEVLVRAEDADRAWEHLPAEQRAGGEWARESVGFLDDRVVRLSRSASSMDDLRGLIAAMHADHVRATLNYVVPLGYIAKGEGGFEPTTVEDDRGPGAEDGTGAAVAVVDTGVADERRTDGWLVNVAREPATSPEKPGSIDPLYQDGQGDLLDFAAGHGTFVAGIVQQVAPDARISCYHAVQADGIGGELDIARALLDAAGDGAQIINLSLGTETEGEQRPVGLEVALELLHERHPDVLVIAAAGNSGSTAPSWPAAFRRVVSVASVTPDGVGSTWSNHGAWVDCSAVGEGVVAPYVRGREDPEVDKDAPDTFPADAWALGTGTSFAAPQVTGLVAAAMSRTPGTTPRDALTQVLAGGEQVPGYGTLVRVLDGT